MQKPMRFVHIQLVCDCAQLCIIRATRGKYFTNKPGLKCKVLLGNHSYCHL